MTELKTLDKIQMPLHTYMSGNMNERAVLSKNLRKEALKWAKKYARELAQKGLSTVKLAELSGKIQVLSEFFNLSEEEVG